MNNIVAITGRLTRDADIRYNSNETQIASFTIAVNRPKRKDGTQEADFPRCVAFNQTADIIGKYTKKGSLIDIQGHLRTGSYENKHGDKVYTMEVVVDKVGLLERAEKKEEKKEDREPISTGWESIGDEDIPF